MFIVTSISNMIKKSLLRMQPVYLILLQDLKCGSFLIVFNIFTSYIYDEKFYIGDLPSFWCLFSVLYCTTYIVTYHYVLPWISWIHLTILFLSVKLNTGIAENTENYYGNYYGEIIFVSFITIKHFGIRC